MPWYRVVSRQGTDMGTFLAKSPEAALDALAQEGGCENHKAVCLLLDTDPTNWTTSLSRFLEGNVALYVEKVSGPEGT